MFTGIILTAGSIGVMLAAGTGLNMMFTWFNNFELDTETNKKQKGSRESAGGPMGGPSRVEALGSRVKPH